jgi:RimJ/RimL family protein N-acetyltransferase
MHTGSEAKARIGPMILQPVTLDGRKVQLVPLTLEHHAGLCAVGLDSELWRWTTTSVETPDQMRQYIETALKWQAEGTALPFATLERASGQVVGSTRFANVDCHNRHVEIGWTWVARPWQRTAVNTEAKYLMLRHAFETLGCLRVEFKTDALNERSRAAILRIGAREEGTFRNHMITDSGRIRHSVYYSIIDSDWPSVKERLEARLLNIAT